MSANVDPVRGCDTSAISKNEIVVHASHKRPPPTSCGSSIATDKSEFSLFSMMRQASTSKRRKVQHESFCSTRGSNYESGSDIAMPIRKRVRFASNTSGEVQCQTIEFFQGDDPQELWWTSEEMICIRNECMAIIEQFQQDAKSKYLVALRLLYKEQKCPTRFQKIVQACSNTLLHVGERARGLEGHIIKNTVRVTTLRHRRAVLRAIKRTNEDSTTPDAHVAGSAPPPGPASPSSGDQENPSEATPVEAVLSTPHDVLIRNESKGASLASRAFASAFGIFDTQAALASSSP